MKLEKLILKNYLDAQRGLTEIEQVDENNVVLSLPLHFSANTRVEVTVTLSGPLILLLVLLVLADEL